MKFDDTISLGSIVAATSIMITIIGAGLVFDRRFTRMETKVSLMWNVFKKKFHIDDNGDDRP